MNPGGTRQSNTGEPSSVGVMLDGPAVSTCRVLLVGSEAFAAHIQNCFQNARLVVKQQVVSDYLMALGQVAHVQPDVVIGQVGLLGSLRQAIITGFRQLAPEATLIVSASADEKTQALQAVEAGFDGMLLEPCEAKQLLALLKQCKPEKTDPNAGQPAHCQTDSLNTSASSDSFRSGMTDPARGSVSSPMDDEGSSWLSGWPDLPPVSATPPAAEKPAVVRAPAPVKPQTTPVASAPHVHDPYDQVDNELGDIDLVDCLLARPREFRSLVLQLVQGRAGIASVAFTEDPQQVPADHAGVWVTYRNRRLGVLHAPPPAVKSQLVPWAVWLGHWLALEDKTSSLWNMAHRDELSGAWNRRYFDHHLARVLTQAAQKRFPVTLLVFDIDNFKTYNDRYGHGAGDEILRETVKLMQSVVREHDVVARIGGDEFAVIFWDPHGPRRPNSSHPDDVREAARRFQHAICTHRFPKLHEQAPGRLTISGGLASFPWDGATPAALLERADAMLLHSKLQGKNAITLGAGARRPGDPFAP